MSINGKNEGLKLTPSLDKIITRFSKIVNKDQSLSWVTNSKIWWFEEQYFDAFARENNWKFNFTNQLFLTIFLHNYWMKYGFIGKD